MQKFGFSKIDITPTKPQYLAGYAGRDEMSTGVADHIFVRASAFEDHTGRRLLIVAFDLLGTPEEFSDAVYNACQKKYGMSRNYIILNSIHTHCAPLMYEDKYSPNWILDTAYYQMVLDSAIKAIDNAIADLEPAVIRFGMGTFNFGINRRLIVDGKVLMRPNPNGFYQSDVPVLQAKRKGKPDTVIYSFACHPTSRGGLLVSADFPGAAAVQFNGELEFLQGAAGSAKVRSVNKDGTAFQEADQAWLDRAGKQIVTYLNEFLASDQMSDITLELAARLMRVEIPLDESKVFTDAGLDVFYKEWGGDSWDFVKYMVNDLREKIHSNTWARECTMELRGITLANNIRFMATSAEITAELAKIMLDAVRRKDEKMFLLGYTGFRTDYLPCASMLSEGGYEGLEAQYIHGFCAPFSPKIDEVVADAARRIFG